MKKPRCFVAMAFGRDDTNALYERKILPVLGRNHITPVIIDRRESLEDVNKQIIEQLGAADLCIADLTYERPSVYFEAGFAQRAGPVIYTARSDHIAPRSSSDGRVHFDLTMKPLIKWDSPSDRTFAKRLEKRLRAAFLNDWKRQQRASDELVTARHTFSKLSVTDRVRLLRRIAKNVLKQQGFGRWTYEKSRDPAYGHLIWDDATGFSVGRRLRGKHLTLVKVKALDSLTKRQIGFLYPELYQMELQMKLSDVIEGGVRPASFTVHCLVIALQPISTARLESVLNNLPAGEHPGQYVVTAKLEDRSTDDRRSIPTVATLDCIAPVKSEAEFRAVLRTLIPTLLTGSHPGVARERITS